MTPIEELVHALVAKRGPLTFAEYQDLVLYHPDHGYYSGAARAGWRGDYLTSSELDTAFGELWSAGLRQVWAACGAPRHFEVLEVGPGEGGLAAGLIRAAEGGWAAALSLRLIEPLPAVAERQKARLAGAGRCSWAASLDELPLAPAGCVIANEVLDNVPVHLLSARNGDLTELHVARRDGDLELRPAPLSPPAAAALRSGLWDPPSPGRDVAVSPRATSLILAAAGSVEQGAVILVDYGHEAGERGAEIVCYSAAGVDDRPLERPGAKDITVHVDWTAARRALDTTGATVTGPVKQREVLHALGAGAMQEKLRARHVSALHEGRGADAVRALSRRSALGGLTDPAGLGGMGVVMGCKGIGPPQWMTDSGDAARLEGSTES